MPVTDLQVATLRALIARETDEGRRLFQQLEETATKTGYFQLLMMAFGEAVRQNFRGKKPADIIEWVGEVRANRDANEQIDPNVAEHLILWVFGKATIDDLDFETRTGHQAMLLVLILEEMSLDPAGVDAFLQNAREVTDKVMGNGDGP